MLFVNGLYVGEVCDEWTTDYGSTLVIGHMDRIVCPD